MIILLKSIIVLFILISCWVVYFVSKQYIKFINSEEVQFVSLLNRFVIGILALATGLFFIGVISTCFWLVFQNIVIQ